jgi:hypothetical protein
MDGVLDDSDNCVDENGPRENNGCPWPDHDGDGVFDDTDKCVNENGPIENNGCPWPDTDGDGVYDDSDICVTTYGTLENNGCPEYLNGPETNPFSPNKTVCPYCGNIRYTPQYNIIWNCEKCTKEFFICNRKGSSDFGIYMNWVNDGTCDCLDCIDEKR